MIQENLLLKDASVPEVEEEKYSVMTLHRPSNVDHKEIFTALINFLTDEVATEAQTEDRDDDHSLIY